MRRCLCVRARAWACVRARVCRGFALGSFFLGVCVRARACGCVSRAGLRRISVPIFQTCHALIHASAGPMLRIFLGLTDSQGLCTVHPNEGSPVLRVSKVDAPVIPAPSWRTSSYVLCVGCWVSLGLWGVCVATPGGGLYPSLMIRGGSANKSHPIDPAGGGEGGGHAPRIGRPPGRSVRDPPPPPPQSHGPPLHCGFGGAGLAMRDSTFCASWVPGIVSQRPSRCGRGAGFGH